MRQATLYLGDCVEVLRGLDAESVDAVVCDPPYGLEFMGKEWDRLDGGLPQEAVWKGRRGAGGSAIGKDDSKPSSRHHVSYAQKPQGFKRCQHCDKRQFSGSPCQCDDPDWVLEYAQRAPSGAIRAQRWHEEWAREVYRVLKPGAHLLAFGGTRTYHRLACAIEDAGFEIRDSILSVGGLAWVHGQGFPKSHNGPWGGTALKPAHEPIVVARKPLIGTVAANVERFGTGGLNVDGCRVEGSGGSERVGEASQDRRYQTSGATPFAMTPGPRGGDPSGRWPPNLLLSHAPECDDDCADGCPVAEMDRQSGTLTSGSRDVITTNGLGGSGRYGSMPNAELPAIVGDSGGASRFFPCFRYEAKPSSAERGNGNHHPTVKPVALMAWLCRLVTPKDGLVLDPFLGSGTTGIAALREGFRFLGVEREPDYLAIAERRIRNDAPMFNNVSVLGR